MAQTRAGELDFTLVTGHRRRQRRQRPSANSLRTSKSSYNMVKNQASAVPERFWGITLAPARLFTPPGPSPHNHAMMSRLHRLSDRDTKTC